MFTTFVLTVKGNEALERKLKINMLKSVAKTRSGNFDVEFEIVESRAVDCTATAFFKINGKVFKLEKVNLNFSDRIDITAEIAEELNIPPHVTKNSRVVFKCDISNVINEVNMLRRKKREEIRKQYNGKIIDSGCGFMMKNTLKNRRIIREYGFDAIEKID